MIGIYWHTWRQDGLKIKRKRHSLLFKKNNIDIFDMIKGNDSYVEDFQFRVFGTTFWQLKMLQKNWIFGYRVINLKNLNSFFANISKTISATSDSSTLIMSRIRTLMALLANASRKQEMIWFKLIVAVIFLHYKCDWFVV